MCPLSVQTLLTLTGIALELIGAILMSIQVFRTFKGIKFIKGGTFDDINKPPLESEEFKAWEQSNLQISRWGLGIFLVGFLLQILSYLPACKF